MIDTTRKWSLLLAGAVAASTWSGAAHAGDPATATMLFNDARQLVAAGDYNQACPKFEESQRLDPGMGTLFNLADCYEHVGRLASAWAMFQDVAASAKAAGQPTRAQVATQRAVTLEPKLSKLTVVAPMNALGLEVRRNGELLGSVLWGNAVPVDPASYTIEASAPGKKRWSTVAGVGPNAARVTVTIPPLESIDAPGTASSSPSPEASPAATPPPSAEQGHDGAPLRAAGAIVAGVGIVGLGVGAAFGLVSISKHSEYASHCAGTVCDAEGVSLHAEAVNAGNVSTVAFVAGGVLATTGAVLWLTAPKSRVAGLRLTPFAGASVAGVSISGGWE